MTLGGESIGSSGNLHTEDEAVLDSQKSPNHEEAFTGEKIANCEVTPTRAKEGGEGVKDAQNARPPGPGKGRECHYCGDEGHWKSDCPNKWRRFVKGPTSGLEDAAVQKAVEGGGFPDLQCPCGRGLCLVLMSRTEKNPGRFFYRCPAKFSFDQCGFFKWCDSVVSDQAREYGSPVKKDRPNVFNSPRTPVKNGVRSPAKFNWQHDQVNSSPQMCSCGAGRCIILTKDVGENVNRKYLACPIRKGNGACRFFQWLDPPPPHVDSEENAVEKEPPAFTLIPEEPRDSGVKDTEVPQANATTPTSPKPGICFICGQDGHWMSDCKGSLRSPCFKCGKVGHWKNECKS